MTYRRKAISGVSVPPRKRGSLRPLSGRCILLALVFLCESVCAGGFQDSLFRSYSSTSNLINQDSLRLSVLQWALSKIGTVSRPGSPNSRMHSPDVTGAGDGRFSFFWVDTATNGHAIDTVFKKDMRITAGGVDTSSPRTIMSSFTHPAFKYFHADSGKSGHVLSFINTVVGDSLMAISEPPAVWLSGIGSTAAGSTVTGATQCYWKNDTFLVVFQRNADNGKFLVMRRVYFVNGNLTQSTRVTDPLTFEDTIVTATNSPDAHFAISNPSIAADNAGNALVMWAVGTGVAGYPKTLQCRLLDATRAKGGGAAFANQIDSTGLSNFYDDAPVVAYATGAFGSVTWSPSGILFRSIQVGSPPIVDTVGIEPGPSVRYPSIASNGRYIAITWMKDTLGSSQIKIAGVRDTIRPGYIPFSSTQDQVRFGDTWLPSPKIPGKTLNEFALNSAMDSIGSVAATWPLDTFVNARIWANRGVRTDSGWWVSQSTRFMDNSGDSAYLLPDSVVINDEVFQPPNNDSTRVYVRVGTDSADQSAWQPWTLARAADSATLAARTMGTYRFFQYKVLLYRGQDTLGTPVVRKCIFRWNAKPSFLPLNSVFINGTPTSGGVYFGAIDTVLSRSDSVLINFSLRDADASDTLLARVGGYPAIIDSVSTLYPTTGRTTFAKLLPCAKSDTTINLLFSASDKRGWAASPQGFSVRTRNSRPQLHVYALLDTNNTGVIDTVEIVSTKSFTVLQTDSVRFLYVCRDTNDFLPQFKAFGILNHVKIDSTQQGINRIYKFRDSIGRGVNDTLMFSFADPETTVTRTAYFRLRNSVPQLHVYALLDTNHTGKTDTLEITSTKSLSLEQNDSIGFMYRCNDTNDYQAQFHAYALLNRARVDSAQQGVNRNYLFRGSIGRAAGDTLVFSFADPDTSVTRSAYFRVNHFPVISSVSAGTRFVHNGDTISVGIGSTVSFTVNAKDTDAAFWDKLSYHYTRKTKDSVTNAASFSFAAARSDSSLLVRVTDSFGKTDSLRFFMIGPWLATDTAANKPFQQAKSVLHDSVAIIIGSGEKDSIRIPLVNTGDDTLKITSLKFKGASSGWITLRAPGQAGSGIYDSLTGKAGGTIDTIAIAQGNTRNITVFLDASKLVGDGIMHDTIIIGTNDFSNKYDTIPVNMEYNGLPRIASISIDFSRSTLPSLSKKALAKAAAYRFPPYAKISIHFTEPMDTASAANGISAYSLFDKRVTNTPPAIAFDRAWAGNDSILSLSPRYTAPSPYFNGFQPPPKFFIPGDSILLTVTSAITDQATTPHGPNGLDVHKIAVRAANADTMIPFRVDSITYTIDSVYPKDKDTGISASTSISLTFSSPPLPTTVDTSKTNNRSLIVRSKYFGNAPVVFKSILVSGSTVTFSLAKQFFYGDTVTCYYRARWVTDSLGYPVVLNNSGIPMELFDTSSTANDKLWSFTVKNVVHTGFSPNNSDTGISTATPITIRFSDSIPLASVDTSKKGNRQLVVSTAFSKGAVIAFDSVRTRGTSVVYYPSRRFFYGDTVFCSYQGLLTRDSLRYSIDLSGKQLLSTNDKAQWHFAVKNIRVIVAKPDSASQASIHPAITIGFSDPLFAGTFDTDTSAKNHSFVLTSRFAFDSALAYASITVSSDSLQVSLNPKSVFFSNDSIHCLFKGFVKTFRYDTTVNLPTDSSNVMASHSWYFYTENTGFYTYPNPYKPGSDPRHCRNAATDPCGIWFTNLHLLKKGITDVIIKVFGMNANPVFSTQTAGINIHFSTSDPSLKPQWKWDTKNQRGELVASGLYFYVITDLKGSGLTKGKLMIVR